MCVCVCVCVCVRTIHMLENVMCIVYSTFVHVCGGVLLTCAIVIMVGLLLTSAVLELIFFSGICFYSHLLVPHVSV